MFGLFTQNKTSAEKNYEGIVTEVVYPNYKWRVSFEATYWFAESRHPGNYNPGDFVRVVGRENTTTLLIEPA